MKRLATLSLAIFATFPAAAAPISILFVGNSYTFGRLDPVLTYNAANVRDLTRPQGSLVVGSSSITPKFSDVTGTNSYGPGMINPTTGVQGNSYSPHSQTNGWGGVPGIFKQFTVQAGLDYDVALSTRNAATLRGHFLNTANSTNWDLRGNISSQKWDKMVLQEQSDEALGPQTVEGVPLGSNFPSIRAYVDLIEDWVHTGRPIQAGVMTPNLGDTTYRERNMYYLGGTTAAGGVGGQYANEAACVAAGGTPSVTVGGVTTSGSCANNALRTIPNNTNFNAATEIYLQQTWARPNLINSPGTPTIDPATGNATYDTTKPVPSYFSTLEAMTTDMTTGMLNVANFADDDGTSGIKGIIPVGQAFLTAVQAGLATRNMYAPDALTDGLIDLWFNDGTHASVAGSYLSALVLFQSLTGRNALSLGAGEVAAAELEIAPGVAVQLQRIAQATVGPDLSASTTVAAANPPANANGWNNADVTVTLTATDNVNGSGVKQIAFATTGAQVGTGIVSGGSASLIISAEGQTTVTYYATDNAGNVETARTLVVQLDKTPPSLSGMPAAGCKIWPPNNKLVNVATVAAQDGLSGLFSFNASVESSEAAAPGRPDTVTAGTGLAPRIISVRATRLGDGPGRTYTLSASATDRAGNATAAVAACVVPHDQGH